MKRFHSPQTVAKLARAWAIVLPRSSRPSSGELGYVLCAALLLCCAGCHSDLQDQPRYEPLESSDFFGDGQSARLPIENTVARGQLHDDEAFYTGRVNGQLVADSPVSLDRALLERGRERFQIYCAICHGPTGVGNGMIVQRGFRRPPSFEIERLRAAPIGHFFDVATNGFGAMPSLAAQIEPRDRWAIAAYIRALQLTRNAKLDDVPADQRGSLQEAQP